MLTICLDESGAFEDNSYTKPLIIGGLVYTGDDFAKEEKRIEQFYKDCCRELNVSYPEALHSTENNYSDNSKLMEKVLTYIKEHDKYYFTAMIAYHKTGDNNGTKDKVISNIADINYGANLYERMATKFIYNNIFYNPDLQKSNNFVNLRLATRSQVLRKKDSSLIQELEKLGYDERVQDDKHIFYLTKSSTFKAALSTKIYENNLDDKIQFDLKVESINYNIDSSTSPFLYLADNVCEIIKNKIKSADNTTNMTKIIKLMKEVVNRDFYCFAFDNIDLIWTNILEKLKQKDLIGVLKGVAEIEFSKSVYQNLYLNYWMPKIKESISNLFDEKLIDTYLAELDYFFSKKESEYEYGLAISKKLLEIVENKKIAKGNYFKYKVNEKIAIAYNHRGAVGKSLDYFLKANSLVECGIPILDVLNLKNRIAVAYENACDFNKALDILTNLLPKLEKIEEALFDVAADMDIDNSASYYICEKGKVLSNIGQVYSFLNNTFKAEEYFLEALETFNSDLNKKITRSYLKHLYIENNEKEKYEKLLFEDYNTSNFDAIKTKILENKDRYELFYYVKSLNLLYSNDVTYEFVKNLVRYIERYMDDLTIIEHPFELIIKHLAELCLKMDMTEMADTLTNKYLNKVTNSEFTINIIIQKSYLDILRLKLNKCANLKEIEKNKKAQKRILAVIKQVIIDEGIESDIFNNFIESTDNSEMFDILDKLLSYMYN
ncbi:MAG: hypothetical protein SOV35_02880 [Clostridium sp.]|nr:hypothetical protein [Clostridium sp.]